MRIIVCYGTFKHAPRPGGHPCGNAYHALREAGYDPEVVKAYGAGLLGPLANLTGGRKEAKRLTGSYWVPVLETDEGEVISGSQNIVEWARSHPREKAPVSAAGA